MLPRIIARKCSYQSDLSKALTKVKEECKCEETKDATCCNVALIGADSKLGELVALLLKQNPLITCLHLQGSAGVIGVKEDLSHMDTSCRVVGHSGSDNYRNAMKTADIVVFLGKTGFSKKTSIGDRVMAEGSRICKLAEKCTKYARRAIVVVCATPVSVMTPLVTDVFKKTHWYHPGRIIGFTGPVSVVINAEVGRYQCFDPSTVDVPLVGGPDLETLVPLFSKATPCPLQEQTGIELTARLRGILPSDFPKCAVPSDNFATAVVPEAIALHRLICAIAFGMYGHEKAIGYCHIRSKILQTCRFLTTKVRFGRHGVVHNYGIPYVNKFEQDLLERALVLVNYREEMAKQYLDYYLSKNKEILPEFKQKEVEKFQEIRKCSMQN